MLLLWFFLILFFARDTIVSGYGLALSVSSGVRMSVTKVLLLNCPFVESPGNCFRWELRATESLIFTFLPPEWNIKIHPTDAATRQGRHCGH